MFLYIEDNGQNSGKNTFKISIAKASDLVPINVFIVLPLLEGKHTLFILAQGLILLLSLCLSLLVLVDVNQGQ